MASYVPFHTSSGQNPLVKFNGLVITEFKEPPSGRCFFMRQTYVRHPEDPEAQRIIENVHQPRGPPRHFHQFQTEFFTVEQGMMILEVDGVERIVTSKDGELTAPAGSAHRFWMHPASTEDMVVLLSASDSGSDYQLDRLFFENWYGYWHDSVVHGNKMNFLQVLSIFDGGDVYLMPPPWVPFKRTVGYWGCVILGRWIGGLLGYSPCFREFTTDWDYAVAKMRGSVFQRHIIDKDISSKKHVD